VAPSSSARKVARLASKGKGKKVRFQGGTVFPAIVLIILVLLTALIVYARQSRPADGSGHPAVGDHWHAAYGMRVCDVVLPKLNGNKEDAPAYALIGVHSHDDGVIHYHPASSKSTGNRANFGVFLDMYGVKLTTSSLQLPADQGNEKFSIKDRKLEIEQDGKPVDVAASPYSACAGKNMVLKVRVWSHFDQPDSYQDYITDLDNIRIRNNGMVFMIAIVEDGTDIKQPDWAAELPELGASDGSGTPVDTSVTTSVAPGDTGATTTVAGSDVATTIADTTPTTVVVPSATTPASTAPASTAPSGTDTGTAPTTSGG
jgi:hypothetical protein